MASENELRALIEEATVDAYGEDEQLVGFFTMIQDHLDVPFETEVLIICSGFSTSRPGLDALASREVEAWEQVDAFIASRKPTEYDAAVALLCDLRDLAARDGREEQAWRRIGNLRTAHAKKSTFIERLDKARPLPPGA